MTSTSRARLVHAAFLLFAAALVARAAQVQLFQTAFWRAKARNQQTAASPLPAPRGMILDERGAMLVESRQLVKLNVAPREVFGDARNAIAAGARRVGALAGALARAGVSPEWANRQWHTKQYERE